MPRREDLKSVLVIGSGPIVIGQGCEFDYSGTQACRVLRAEGIRVSLVNSNPATIMTDPEFADATYVEPITPDVLEKVIAKERPDALLPTLGGQTALNAAVALHASGALKKYNVELIGADIDAIEACEDRERFKEIVTGLGAEVPRSQICRTLEECFAATADLGLPVVVRPSFTLGGAGSGIAYNEDDLRRIAGAGLDASPTTEVLLEESIIGWKEFELELMRDRNDNVVIVCSIENVDPMGVHTGDSVTVAPAMTLTDREYQHMRDVAIQIIRAVGVDTGGCNIQFAVDPKTGRMVVIEMNPRVSRSSALASKATGFPIAKIATRLAIGYTLDEIPNDITGQTPASFEPALDYVVVKIPRFAFEKFPGADTTLTTHMKSVGEAMAIGRSFGEALQKAQRSLESTTGPFRFNKTETDADLLLDRCRTPHDGRLNTMLQALRAGASPQAVAEVTGIDPWFVDQVVQIHEISGTVAAASELDTSLFRLAKSHGFSDAAARGAPRHRGGPGARPAARARRAAGLPRGRHLRRRVRGPHPVPVLDVRRGRRGAAGGPAEGDHPRQRPQQDRAGHRVRLRLRARLVRAARRGLRDRDGQLQPGDRLDRLRHLLPAVLRAADPGRRARSGARRAGGGTGRGRDRAARRADAAGACARPRSGRGAGRRHVAGRDPPRRGPRRVRVGARRRGPDRAARRGRAVRGGGGGGGGRDRLPGAGAAVVRARRARHGDRLRRGDAAGLRGPRHDARAERPTIRC